MGEGSGFVVSPDGLIVTNAHVAGGADKIEVTFKDGRKLTATLKGVDEKTDLALLKVDGGSAPLPYVVFGDSSKVRPGDKVIAVGNPFGLGGTVTAGIVSATGREIGSGPYDDYIQVDAPINRGNSGGPTFNLRGEVVGVNTAIFSPSGGSVGIGFAIAANLAKSVVDDLRDDGTVERGYLGVGIQGVDEDLARALKLDRPRGALVSRVETGSPAEKAGVRRGDVVLDFNGTPIDRVGQLSRAVAAVDAGARRAAHDLARRPRADPLGPGRRDADPAGGGRRLAGRAGRQPAAARPRPRRDHARGQGAPEPRGRGRGRAGDPGHAGEPGRREGHRARRRDREREPAAGEGAAAADRGGPQGGHGGRQAGAPADRP
jgi:S1-C subfamily serine protease